MVRLGYELCPWSEGFIFQDFFRKKQQWNSSETLVEPSHFWVLKTRKTEGGSFYSIFPQGLAESCARMGILSAAAVAPELFRRSRQVARTKK